MMQIDYFSVISFIRYGLQVVSESFFDFHQKLLFKGVDFRFMNEYVIDSNTGLTAVKEFTENDSWHCVINVSSLIDNDRTFTTKLKQAWSQVFSGLNGDKLSCFCWSCETDEIKR